MRHQRPLLEDIERRILYAADTPGGALAAALPRQGHEAADAHVQVQPAAQQPAALELVVLDERVEDVDRLAQDIAAQAGEGRRIEFIRVGNGEDGIDAITAALAGREDVAAIHVVSHGSSGRLQLGREVLDGDVLMGRAGEIAAWGAHLREGADILLYGCDVASDEAGRALVQGLAALTGADVAGSDNVTGAAALRGDWVLEQHSGLIETAALRADSWAGTLLIVPGEVRRVNTTTANDQIDAVTAVAPDGSYVVVWSGNGPGHANGIFFQRYGADGNKLGGEVLASVSLPSTEHYVPAIAMNGSGHFVITWIGSPSRARRPTPSRWAPCCQSSPGQ